MTKRDVLDYVCAVAVTAATGAPLVHPIDVVATCALLTWLIARGDAQRSVSGGAPVAAIAVPPLRGDGSISPPRASIDRTPILLDGRARLAS